MAMQASEIEALIKTAFPDAIVTIEDLRGDGDHYACRVVSSAFAGKTVCNSTRWSIMLWVGAWVVNCMRWHCRHLPQPNPLLVVIVQTA